MTETELSLLDQALLDQDLLLSQGKTIPLATVRAWMDSDTLQVQDRAFSLLAEHSERLEMPSPQEREEFSLRYLEHYFRTDPQGGFALGRYQAGYRLCAWFEQLWSGRPATAFTLERVRDLLARLSATGEEPMRDALVTAVFEHLFQDPAIAEFFGDWRRDPALSPVYSEALALAQLWDKDSDKGSDKEFLYTNEPDRI